jgi:DNA-directed RNA polymerase specialized sigma24 family protein
MVIRRCRQLLRDEDDALDAAKDVFVRLIERQRELHARYPSSLLYRIATNVCLNRIRDRGRRPAAGGARDDSQLEAIARAEIPGGESDATAPRQTPKGLAAGEGIGAGASSRACFSRPSSRKSIH